MLNLLLPTVTSSSDNSLPESSLKPSSISLLSLRVEASSSCLDLGVLPVAACMALLSPASRIPILPSVLRMPPKVRLPWSMSKPTIRSPLSSSNSPTSSSLDVLFLLPRSPPCSPLPCRIAHMDGMTRRKKRSPSLPRIDLGRNASGM